MPTGMEEARLNIGCIIKAEPTTKALAIATDIGTDSGWIEAVEQEEAATDIS